MYDDESVLVYDEPFSGGGGGYHERPEDVEFPGDVKLDDPEDDMLIEQQQDAERDRLFALEPRIVRVAVTRTLYKSTPREGKSYRRPGWSVVVEGAGVDANASDVAGDVKTLEDVGNLALAKWREALAAKASGAPSAEGRAA